MPGCPPGRLRYRAHRGDPRGSARTKIRLGRFAAGPVEWRPGDQVRITVDDVAGTRDRVSTTYKGLADGDLGVELPLERVPVVQKRAVQLCRENAKPVIVATQVPESMRLLAFTPDPAVRNQVALTWGRHRSSSRPRLNALVRLVDEAMMSVRGHQPGDLLVIIVDHRRVLKVPPA